jgi:hypothetical protein
MPAKFPAKATPNEHVAIQLQNQNNHTLFHPNPTAQFYPALVPSNGQPTGKADASLDRPLSARQEHGVWSYQQKLRFFQSQIPHKPSNPTPIAPGQQRVTRSRYETKFRPQSSPPSTQNPHAEKELDSPITSRTAAVPRELPPRIDGRRETISAGRGQLRQERRRGGRATDLERASRGRAGDGGRRKW